MDILQAIILGIVQGASEFLPISSSAHLVIVPWLFNWTDNGLSFDVALHWGTLLAVLVYFRWDILNLARGFWHSLWPATRDFKENIWQKLSWLIILASAPAAIIGFLLEKYAESSFRNPLLISLTVIIFGFILLLSDKFGQKKKDLGHITSKTAFGIGIAQAFAIIPGVSRSGATISAGLFLGLTRQDAAKFSFLMSAPIIFGAGLVALPSLQIAGNGLSLFFGLVASAVSGFLAIKYLLKLVSSHSYKIFFWYRLIFSILIVIVYVVRH